MTHLQRYKLNKLIKHSHNFVSIDTQTLMYYKAYIKIYNSWEDIVDKMNPYTLSSVFPNMQKLFNKNILKYLQIYCKSDIIFSIEIANTYGTDVVKLLLEY